MDSRVVFSGNFSDFYGHIRKGKKVLDKNYAVNSLIFEFNQFRIANLRNARNSFPVSFWASRLNLRNKTETLPKISSLVAPSKISLRKSLTKSSQIFFLASLRLGLSILQQVDIVYLHLLSDESINPSSRKLSKLSGSSLSGLMRSGFSTASYVVEIVLILSK